MFTQADRGGRSGYSARWRGGGLTRSGEGIRSANDQDEPSRGTQAELRWPSGVLKAKLWGGKFGEVEGGRNQARSAFGAPKAQHWSEKGI